MKQYWRVGTIRALMSLVLGMFVLGRFYYPYIPILQDLGLIGALVLGASLTFFFLGLGWLYDAKANMWSAKVQVQVERHPYYYIPSYKDYAFLYPLLFSTMQTLGDVIEKENLDTSAIQELMVYLNNFFSRLPEKKDIVAAMPKARDFLQSRLSEERYDRGVPLSFRLKRGFETQNLRLSWIQSLTGMFQDALVFGILYVVILLPWLEDPIAQLLIGLFLISFPLYIVLVALGWYYDRRLQIWSPDMVVKVERTPYTFVPSPRELLIDYPFYYSFYTVMREVFVKRGLDVTSIERIMVYLQTYMNLTAKDEKDMDTARKLRAAFGPVFQNQGVDEEL